eukprot:CAMPEP_0181129746 /NCGR_PEP_ID=MMETSP1071-20121207/29486_1 /TAXON_ID=35127 /ORGANISM="Thalassiosira sp., Strain NH16" /LENGTH=322 /DNA_ID=CAMNT_0023215753 /DNA_START=223 /DNA_END=1191 /DNA_ORIENTATION=-
MAPTKKKKTASHDISAESVGEMSDAAKQRSNGIKSAPKTAIAAKASASSGKDKVAKKPSKKQPTKNDASSKKKQKRKSDKDAATSPPAAKKKRKVKLDTGSARSSNGGAEDDSSEDEGGESPRKYSQLPEIGDEIAIKCPPDPPYPEGWYTGVVTHTIVHDEEGPQSSKSKAKVGPRSKAKKIKNFTLHIEWDGGGDEVLINPEWRMKGDAPDKQGRVSHRDAKLRPYFKYWVNRLNSMSESDKKLSKTRAGKSTRVDPDQKIEWIQCANPSCGKWRPLPPYMKSSAILESCNNKWYCVLNSWDEAIASCGAPQETGYMPAK